MKNMTAEQLIKKLIEERDLALKQLAYIGVGLGDNMDHVKKALEKQDPLKPIYGDDDQDYIRCPICNYPIASMEQDLVPPYCKQCGQLIKWGE